MQRRRRWGASTGKRAAVAAAAVLVAGASVTVASDRASADVAPHAQYLNQQWGLSAIGAPSAWAGGTATGVRIGIVDTGVDTSQQDLQGKVVASKVIVSQPSSGCAAPQSAEDDNGHGTHVAGIAAASGAFGVDGVAPGASLVVAKVLDCQGSGNYSDVVAGIQWVVSQGARIVNLSLGDAGTGLVDQSNVTGNPLAGALQDAWNHGAVGVVAAGNNSNGLLGLGEANFTNVPAVVVAATGPNGNLASYSNSIDNAQWGVAAPGGDDPNGPTTPDCGHADPAEILSTYWRSDDPTACYATDEGTSMATPFVSGTLALLLGRGLSVNQAVQTLLGTATHSVACGSDCSGFVNAAAAVGHAPSPASAAPAPSPPSSNAAASPARSAPRAAAVTGTTAAPTTSPPATTSSSPTTSTDPGRTLAARARATDGHKPSGGGGGWWPQLLVLGLALLGGVAVVGRRVKHTDPPAR